MHSMTPEDLARVARILTGFEVNKELDQRSAEQVALWKRRVLKRLQDNVQAGIDAIDLLLGDPDLEDATDLEDDFTHWNVVRFPGANRGPGCEIADAGGQCDEDEANTALVHTLHKGPGCEIADTGERETWSHWMDHPAEAHVGVRPGWNAPAGGVNNG